MMLPHKSDFGTTAGAALVGAVKLSNEVIGTMRLLELGVPVPRGVARAMRGYLRAIELYVEQLETLGEEARRS